MAKQTEMQQIINKYQTLCDEYLLNVDLITRENEGVIFEAISDGSYSTPPVYIAPLGWVLWCRTLSKEQFGVAMIADFLFNKMLSIDVIFNAARAWKIELTAVEKKTLLNAEQEYLKI